MPDFSFGYASFATCCSTKGENTKSKTPKADNAYNQANYIRATELYKSAMPNKNQHL
ncbi:MAG: hypothetical protein IPP34_14640 [Bacteroidetes bacterium]|nr:hypothetical protein [Bacteroidota bacterium]